jgi:hypothetical protein
MTVWDIITFCSLILFSAGLGFSLGVSVSKRILTKMMTKKLLIEFGVSEEEVEQLQEEFEK